jgi:hypothetical protein
MKYMDRLTGWDNENAYYLKCFEGDKGGCISMCSDECFKCHDSNEACKRLAQYEDTGLLPEEVVKLKNSKLMEVVSLNDLLHQENEKYKKRLQISPFGDDKIDELEQALEFIRFENENLKAKYDKLNDFEQTQCAKLLANLNILVTQNKLMLDALICLPGAISGDVTTDVCDICSRKEKCSECIIDNAIREGMG